MHGQGTEVGMSLECLRNSRRQVWLGQSDGEGEKWVSVD